LEAPSHASGNVGNADDQTKRVPRVVPPPSSVPQVVPQSPAAPLQSAENIRPYTRIRLRGLEKNQDLNGTYGIVLPIECSKTADVAGALKVRLENNREVAVKPVNLEVVEHGIAAVVSPQREERLQAVMHQICTEAKAIMLAGSLMTPGS